MTKIKHIYKLLCLGILMLLLFNKISIAQTPEFIIGSTTNVTTATVTLPVTANKFTQILAWQGSINWNNSKLHYMGTNAVANALNGIQFNGSTIGSKGLLSFIWLDNNLLPQSLADSTILFTITFNVVANAAGNTDVSFSSNPTALQVSDLNGNKVLGVNYVNGNVSFANEVVPPEFTIGSIANITTSSITVPVTSKNFIQLLATQGSIVWDNTRLTFANTSAVATQLNGVQFNNTVIGNIGQLSFLWIDPNLIPQTIADSAVLFNITFNVIGSTTGLTNINFTNSPTLLQTSDAVGMPITNTVYNNGIISFPGATLPPTFVIPTISNIETNNFSVPVTAKNFTQLKAMQGSITWDNRKYNYASASSSLSQLNGILFNAAVSGDIGTLSYVWADASSAVQTISDNSVLFTITFSRVCSGLGINDINFTNIPTAQLVVNSGDSAVTNAVYVNGRLSIPSIVSPAVYITTPSNILCTAASPVLSSIISNGGIVTTYQWYKNNALIVGAITATYTSNTFNNNDSIKCIITSNVACAATNIATSNVIGLRQQNAISDTVIISGCNSVVYNSIVYTADATKNDTLKTVYGCDSVYRLAKIFILPLTPLKQTTNLSGCNSILYNSITYTSSTTIIDTVRTLQGCDSIYNTVNITLNNSIAGNIRHITKGSVIQNVKAFLNGVSTGSIITTGNYKFDCIDPSTVGTIRLSKNNDIKKNNGVSAIDVILITNHILNKAKLNNPYKIIAADVNNNKTITNIDLIFMKRLILGIDTTFTGNRLWAFVDSAYKFPDTTNPFPYKDSIGFTNLTSNTTNQTFIGVKLGDVNYDWNPALARGMTTKPVELVYEIRSSLKVRPGGKSSTDFQPDLIYIPITVKNFKDLTALQYTLNFNNKNYEFVGIENNKLGIEFNEQQATINGAISFLWVDVKGVENTMEDDSEIFTLVLKSKWQVTSGKLDINNLQLTVNNSITEIEAWDKDNQQHNIILTKGSTIHSPLATSEKWTVSPNPNDGNLVVSLSSNTNKIIVFELTNAFGKTLSSQAVEAVKGNNSFHLNLNKNAKLATGVYFIKVIGQESDHVKKIIVKG